MPSGSRRRERCVSCSSSDIRREPLAGAGLPTAFIADVPRSGDVLLEIGRRHAQHLGDVVEAVDRDVRGQQRLASMLHAEQVADALAYSTRFNRCNATSTGSLAVRRAQPRRDSLRAPRRTLPTCSGRAAVRRAAASATAQPAHDLFPTLRVRRDFGGRMPSSESSPARSASLWQSVQY